VSGWSTLTEDLPKGGDKSADVCQGLLNPPSPSLNGLNQLLPLRRSSVSVDYPLTRKGIGKVLSQPP